MFAIDGFYFSRVYGKAKAGEDVCGWTGNKLFKSCIIMYFLLLQYRVTQKIRE